MYLPAAFRVTEVEKLHSLMREYSFATLVTRTGGSTEASHLPLLLDTDAGALGTLRGHMARGNPQWRDLETQEEVLVLFQGPHAYISPTWYENRPAVPTWNYAVVHAYARPRVVQERKALLQLLNDLVAAYDPAPECIDEIATPDIVERLLPGIVGFELEITRLEGKWKLGQNRSEADRRGSVAALSQNPDAAARETARWMAALEEGDVR